MAESIQHRVFDRCGHCGRDIARWENRPGWWHLDHDFLVDHVASTIRVEDD